MRTVVCVMMSSAFVACALPHAARADIYQCTDERFQCEPVARPRASTAPKQPASTQQPAKPTPIKPQAKTKNAAKVDAPVLDLPVLVVSAPAEVTDGPQEVPPQWAMALVPAPQLARAPRMPTSRPVALAGAEPVPQKPARSEPVQSEQPSVPQVVATPAQPEPKVSEPVPTPAPQTVSQPAGSEMPVGFGLSMRMTPVFREAARTAKTACSIELAFNDVLMVTVFDDHLKNGLLERGVQILAAKDDKPRASSGAGPSVAR